MTRHTKRHDAAPPRPWLVRPWPLLAAALAAACLLQLAADALVTLLDALGQCTGALAAANGLSWCVVLGAAAAAGLGFRWALGEQHRMGLARVSLRPTALATAGLLVALVADLGMALPLGDAAETASGVPGMYWAAALLSMLRSALPLALLAGLLLPVFRGRWGTARAIGLLCLALTAAQYGTALLSHLMREGLQAALLGPAMTSTGWPALLLGQQTLALLCWSLSSLLLTAMVSGHLPGALAWLLALQAVFERLLPGKLALLLADHGGLPRLAREYGPYAFAHLGPPALLIGLVLLRVLWLRARHGHASEQALPR